MSNFTIKQGDLEPGLFVTIDNTSGAVVSFATVTSIQLRFATSQGRELWVRGMTQEGTSSASYAWQQGDTDTPGIYYGEVIVTWFGGRVQTYPPMGYLLIDIEPIL